MEKAKVYFEAVGPYEAQDVERAVSDFLAGDVPAGWNVAFPPSAPQVGSAVRRAMEARLEREHRRRMLHPALPAPDVEKTPESQARVMALLKTVTEKLSVTDDLRSDSAMLRRANARHDEVFAPTLRYTVGDPDAENGDMGGRKAS